jgi:hypothetical protein
LGTKLDLEVIDLDAIFTQHPSHFFSRKLYINALRKLLADKTDWIVDGYHGKRMPDWYWKSADIIIFIDLPKDQLKRDVLARQKSAKQNNVTPRVQSMRINNLKNYSQIHLLDKSLRNTAEKVYALKKDGAEFKVLVSASEVGDLLSDFNAEK